jgi:hypothetical protein
LAVQTAKVEAATIRMRLIFAKVKPPISCIRAKLRSKRLIHKGKIVKSDVGI